jgi:hypothetical protein
MEQQTPAGKSALIIKVLCSHSDTPCAVGLLWTSDQPDAKKLYPATHNTHKSKTSILSAGFEPAIPARERSRTHALDREATEITTPY